MSKQDAKNVPGILGVITEDVWFSQGGISINNMGLVPANQTLSIDLTQPSRIAGFHKMNANASTIGELYSTSNITILENGGFSQGPVATGYEIFKDPGATGLYTYTFTSPPQNSYQPTMIEFFQTTHAPEEVIWANISSQTSSSINYSLQAIPGPNITNFTPLNDGIAAGAPNSSLGPTGISPYGLTGTRLSGNGQTLTSPTSPTSTIPITFVTPTYLIDNIPVSSITTETIAQYDVSSKSFISSPTIPLYVHVHNVDGTTFESALSSGKSGKAKVGPKYKEIAWRYDNRRTKTVDNTNWWLLGLLLLIIVMAFVYMIMMKKY